MYILLGITVTNGSSTPLSKTYIHTNILPIFLFFQSLNKSVFLSCLDESFHLTSVGSDISLPTTKLNIEVDGARFTHECCRVDGLLHKGIIYEVISV